MEESLTNVLLDQSNQLTTQLENLEAIDDRELKSIKMTKELLSSSHFGSVFDQELNSHHLTGSALVISKQGLLMHFHKKIPLWMQPGGHLDKKSEDGLFEFPIEAATRETFEETGLKVRLFPELFHVDVHETPSGHVHYDFRYVGFVENDYFNPPMGESQKVAWIKKSNWNFITDPALSGAMKKLIERPIKELS